MRVKSVPYSFWVCTATLLTNLIVMKREDERDIPAGSMRAINHQLPVSLCFPASYEPPGLPVVRVLLLLLMLLLVLGQLQLPATSARTGRGLTVHIISTPQRSQVCNSCTVCLCLEGWINDLTKVNLYVYLFCTPVRMYCYHCVCLLWGIIYFS